MFDIDTGKLLIVAVVALVVIGPKDLPRVLRQVGQTVGKLRRMASEFQGQFMDAIKDAELEDIRKELKDLEKKAETEYNFNPLQDIQAEVTSAVDAVNAVGASDPGIASPVSNFVLPERTVEADTPTLLAEGVAPTVGDTASPVDERPARADTDAGDERVKRKVFVKPHRSRFARLNSDRTVQLTGQAISMRQRTVRARKSLPHDAVNS